MRPYQGLVAAFIQPFSTDEHKGHLHELRGRKGNHKQRDIIHTSLTEQRLLINFIKSISAWQTEQLRLSAPAVLLVIHNIWSVNTVIITLKSKQQCLIFRKWVWNRLNVVQTVMRFYSRNAPPSWEGDKKKKQPHISWISTGVTGNKHIPSGEQLSSPKSLSVISFCIFQVFLW